MIKGTKLSVVIVRRRHGGPIPSVLIVEDGKAFAKAFVTVVAFSTAFVWCLVNPDRVPGPKLIGQAPAGLGIAVQDKGQGNVELFLDFWNHLVGTGKEAFGHMHPVFNVFGFPKGFVTQSNGSLFETQGDINFFAVNIRGGRLKVEENIVEGAIRSVLISPRPWSVMRKDESI